jgi:DNA-binding transcriptional MerR regulator
MWSRSRRPFADRLNRASVRIAPGRRRPVGEVARSPGLRASAISHYEWRGLLSPASRQSGGRWYGPAGIRRLAIIRRWKETGRMSLEEIADILAGREPPPGAGHMLSRTGSEALRVQIGQMEAAMAARPGLPAQITPGKAPGEAAVTWALTTGRRNSESQAMRPAAGSQCGVRRSIRGEEWK